MPTKEDPREARPERFIWGDDEDEDPFFVIRYDEEARQEVEFLLEEQNQQAKGPIAPPSPTRRR